MAAPHHTIEGLVARLNEAANGLRANGRNGWANTCTEAACQLLCLVDQIETKDTDDRQ